MFKLVLASGPEGDKWGLTLRAVLAPRLPRA